MILFLYGQDSFRSHEKLVAIKNRYIDASLGDTNLSVADFTDQDYDYTEIARMVLAMPFLAKSRLVVIKNLLSSKKTKNIQEKIINLLPKISPSTILVFYEAGAPDKRLALFKKLVKLKQSQQFKPLEPPQLVQWIKKEVNFHQVQIEPSAIDLLIKYCGNDLWRLKNELEKLSAFSSQLSAQDVENLVKPNIDAKIFALIDALGQKNKKSALQELNKLISKEEEELYILTMIIYQFRNLLIIKDNLANNAASHQLSAISRESGLHPYVVGKTLRQCQNFTLEELKNIYQQLLECDIKIKTGELEPKLALELLLFEL